MTYHITPEGAKPCSTTPEKCRYKGEHFSDEVSAAAAFEKVMKPSEVPEASEKCMNSQPTLADIAETETMIPRFHAWRDVSVKDMDAAALTMALTSETRGCITSDNDRAVLEDAIAVASYLHRDQTRANRKGFNRTPYVEHPLRNTVRLVRMGFTDRDILVSSLLHDTVEDCAEEMTGGRGLSASDTRSLALMMVEKRFGVLVSRTVGKVSNPVSEDTAAPLPRAEKRRVYREHLVESIDDVASFAVKLADFKDNAGGLHHNLISGNERMVANNHAKYAPCVSVFEEKLEELRDDLSLREYHGSLRAIGEIRNRIEELGNELNRLGIKPSE